MTDIIKSMTKRNWIILSIIVVGAILLRVLPQWNEVIVDGQVWFRGVDSYYHMRLIDNMVHNFPYPQYQDIFTVFPQGVKVGFNPLMSWIISSVGVMGFDYNLFAAFFPSVVGGLTLIPVFFIGKELFSKKVGFLACVFVAVLPTEFLHRTLFGFADHHALETLLATIVVLFLILMVKYDKKRYPIIAGITLGAYLLNWAGGHFLVLTLVAWFIIQIIYCRLKDLPENNLCRNMLIVFGIAFAMYLPYLRFTLNTSIMTYLPFALACFIPFWLWNKGTKTFTIVSMIITLGISAAVLYTSYLYVPVMLELRSVFHGGSTSISEATPSDISTLLYTTGITFFLFIAGIFRYFKEHKKSLLLIVWAIILLAATIGQRRWEYYFVVPLSLIAAYFTFYAARWVKENSRPFTIAIIILFAMVTSLKGTIAVVTMPNNIDADWRNTLTWMRDNTPFPHIDDNAYYDVAPIHNTNYGVLSWWDYGHWITQVAHRTPCSNPAYQNQPEGSKFFCSKTEEEALKEIEPLGVIRYIIITEEMVTNKYYAVVKQSGKDTDRLESVLLQLWNNELESYKLIRTEGKVRIYEKVQ